MKLCLGTFLDSCFLFFVCLVCFFARPSNGVYKKPSDAETNWLWPQSEGNKCVNGPAFLIGECVRNDLGERKTVTQAPAVSQSREKRTWVRTEFTSWLEQPAASLDTQPLAFQVVNLIFFQLSFWTGMAVEALTADMGWGLSMVHKTFFILSLNIS